ncbi:MAG TPA: calcium-binding protein [Acetobacteraceae bacterium]|nr:calcium-binding protein [Acetobacteraceae bacterium]
MSGSVTVPGGGGTTITIGGSSNNQFLATIIRNSILLASVAGGGANFETAASQAGGQWTLPSAPIGSQPDIAIIPSAASGAVTIPSGYQYVIDESTSATLAGGSVQVIATDGIYNLTGNSSLASFGNNTVTASGTYNVYLGGSGTNNVTLTGQGTYSGSTGSNTVVVTDTATGGSLVLSNGTDSVLAGGDQVSVVASGSNATLDGGNVTVLSVQVTGNTDTIIASANTTDASIGGAGNYLFGSLSTTSGGTVNAAVSGSADTVAAFGASQANIAVWGTDAKIFGGTNTSGTTTVTLSGGQGGAQGSNTLFGGAGMTSVLLGAVAASITGGKAEQSGKNWVLGGSGVLNVVDNGGFNDTIAAWGASTATVQVFAQSDMVFGTLTDGSAFYASIGGGSSTVVASSDTVAAEAGPASIVAAGDNGLILGGTGSFAVTQTGGNGDTIAAYSASSTSVDLQGEGGGAGAMVFGGANTISVSAQDVGNTIVGGAGASSINVASEGGGATNEVILGATTATGSVGAMTIEDFGRKDTIAPYGATSAAVTLAGTLGLVYGGTGALTVSIAGGFHTDDIISGGAGSTNVTVAGSGSMAGANSIYGGSGSLSVVDNGNGDTIAAFSASSANITVTGAGDMVFGGTNGATVNATSSGATNTTVIGGSGSLDFVGGTAGATVFGAAGGSILFSNTGIGTVGSLFYQASAGNETLNASASGSNNLFNAGNDSTGSNTIVGGSGNDTFVAGTGADSFVAGTGDNWFLFLAANGSASANDTVTGFASGQDTVFLANYGGSEASAVFNPYGGSGTTGYTTSSGNTTFHLADGTQITFTDTTLTQLQNHVVAT